MLVALLAALASATVTSSAFAAAAGVVSAQRAGTGPFTLAFAAGGSQTRASGLVTYREPQGYTLTARVTCYYEEAGPFGGRRAVFTGPVIAERNPDNNTVSMVVWVSDGASNIGADAFDVAVGALLGPDCRDNFPLDRFDDTAEFLYVVTRGNIIVR